MKRKNLFILIAAIVIIAVIVGNFYTRKYAVLHSDPVDAIPQDAAYFLEVKNNHDGVSALAKAGFFRSLCSDSSFAAMRRNMLLIDSISASEEIASQMNAKQIVYISAHPTKADEFDYLFLLNIPRGETERAVTNVVLKLIGEDEEESVREYEDVKIHEVNTNKANAITFAVSRGILMLSRTSFLVEDAIRQLKSGVSFKKQKAFTLVNKRVASDEYAALFINSAGTHDLLSAFIDPSHQLIQESTGRIWDWSRWSVSLEDKGLRMTGNNSSRDTGNLLSAFRGIAPVESRIAGIAPGRTALLISYTSTDLPPVLDRWKNSRLFFAGSEYRKAAVDSFSKKFKVDLTKNMRWAEKELACIVTEPASNSIESNLYAYVRAGNAAEAVNQLKNLQTASSGEIIKYRQRQIVHINITALVPMFFGSQFSDMQDTWFTSAGDYIIFAATPAILKSAIDDIEDKKTLERSADFKLNTSFSGFSGVLNVYFNMKRGEKILRAFGNESISPLISEDGILNRTIESITLSVGKGSDLYPVKAHLNFNSSSGSPVRLLWSAQLDTVAATPPCLIVDGSNELMAVQDLRNNLYLLDESGKIIWKKNIGETIVGNINSITSNGYPHPQLVFNSATRLFQLDLNGETKSNFPLKLPAPATTGCVIGRANENVNENIFIWCSNGLMYAYEVSGKPVDSWVFNQFVTGLVKSPELIKIGPQYNFILQNNERAWICSFTGKLTPLGSIKNSPKRICPLEVDSAKKLSLYVLQNDSSFGHISMTAPSVFLRSNQSGITDFAAINGKDEILVLLKNDSLLATDDDEEEFKLLKRISPDQHFIRQQNGRSYSGIGNTADHTFFLINSEGNIPAGFPAKGSSDFYISPTEKVFIGDGDMVYVYGM